MLAPRFEYRNQKALDFARGQDCTLLIPGVCNGDPATTVACHANWSCGGKGMSHKAHDFAIAFGCDRCHAWLDHGGASRDEKMLAFLPGLLKTQTILFREGIFR